MKPCHFIILAVAATTAAACNSDGFDDSDTPAARGGMTIRAMYGDAAHDSSTRTDFDGVRTVWSDGDAMSVMIRDGSGGVQPAKFTVTDPAEGIFVSDDVSPDDGATYDLYAIYPYNPDKTSIGGDTDDARFRIGAATQTQHGADASHVAPLDPLVGRATGAGADDAVLTMNHSAAVMKIVLRNSTGAAISSVNSVGIAAPEGAAIAGSYAIDLGDGSATPTGMMRRGR